LIFGGEIIVLGADMNDAEKVARTNDVDPDQPLRGMHRIVVKGMIISE